MMMISIMTKLDSKKVPKQMMDPANHAGKSGTH